MTSNKRPGALNYTTNVEASRTISEMHDLLGRAGASHIGTQYGRDRKPTGLSFTIETEFGPRTFVLPVDVTAAQRLLAKEEADGAFRAMKKAAGTFSSPEQAQRTAWRVMKDWLEAQLALVDYHMVKLDQVMLPYLEFEPGETLYDRYLETERRALSAGGN